MTREIADYKVRLIAEGMGYVFDDNHYFEFVGNWTPPRNHGLVSYVYLYHQPIETKNGLPLPVGEPIYWICNDLYTRPMDEWMEFNHS